MICSRFPGSTISKQIVRAITNRIAGQLKI